MSGALGSGRRKFEAAAVGKLIGVWKMVPGSLELYAKAVIDKMENKDPHLICMAGAIMK